MSEFNNMIAKFNAEAKNHQDSQQQNPFSGSYCGHRLAKLGEENYGRPVAGSKTEKRGLQAKSHINKEILELCESINDLYGYNMELMKKQQEHDSYYNNEMVSNGTVIVTFGELFEVYSRINDKVVGLLIAAKRKGLVHFEKEIMFQRRDDDEFIMLNKPIEEIRLIMKEVKSPTPDISVSSCDSDKES